MANRFVKHPGEVVAVGDTVKVWVESIDKERGKIGLTMVEDKRPRLVFAPSPQKTAP
jgi:uncharacterized protein